jgi:hypothetical protein
MSEMQSLANQLHWCITSKDYLNDLNAEIRSVANRYQATVDELRASGYMEDLLPQIEQMSQEFQQSSQDLIRHIETEHLAYIEKQNTGIRGALEGLGIGE